MDKLNISVTHTIDSGVRPIELKCTPIYDCLFSNVAGLRSRALVNSVDYGTLDPGDYMPALEDDRESASSFTARNLRVVLGALPALQSQARGISLFLLSCPVSLVRRGTLAAEVTRLLRTADPKCAEAVCLSFAPELLRLPPKDLQSALLHIRSLGCKVAVVDETGKVLDTTVVYPTYGARQEQEAIATLAKLIAKDGVENIAIGNGTASRETEQMAVKLIHQVNEAGAHVSYMIVSEAGASVYSASKLAAEEFPQFDVNLRSAVSIARRLQDPLAELVKIDPKAIGVGQYQHDMPAKQLDEALGGVVEDCVNAVGVDINTASPSLLQRVAGLNGTTAKNVVAYREENGPFTSRAQIKKVPKLGPKAFQQCAGFLRVPESKSVLDNTAVHPESYDAAKALLELMGYTLADVRAEKLADLPQRLKAYGEAKAAEAVGVGIPTLRDITSELLKPGRDVREELPQPILRTDVMEIKDLKPGMVLSGTVRNVIDFGAFVDIGVHQDGLVHISQISNKFIKHPSEVLSVGDVVKVVVLDVDEKKKRIGLSIKQAAGRE